MKIRILCSFIFTMASYSAVSGTLSACIDHYPPLQIVAEEPYGESISAMIVLAHTLGHQISFVEGPNFARCLRMLELGQVDLVAGLIDTPERREFAYLIPYRYDTDYVFINGINSPNISQYEHLVGTTVGITKNTMYFEKFDQDQTINKVLVKDIKNALQLLLKSRIDVVITSQDILTNIINEIDNVKGKIKVNPLSYKTNRSLYFGVSKKNKLVLNETTLNKAYQANENNVYSLAIDQFIRTHPELY